MNKAAKVPLFIWLCVVAALPLLALNWLITKGDDVIYFNFHNNIFADHIFAFFTRLAEFPLLALCIILFGRIKGVKAAIESLVALAITGIVVQLVKRLVIENNFRPHLFFEKIQTLRIIEGIEPLRHYSFPSGHTAAAFCLFATISFYSNSKAMKLLCFILAIFTGISRIYLLQHFLSDVLGGIIIGSAIAWAINFYFAKLNLLKRS
jgi:membrane-associated phospholipid phosphatase